MSRIRSLIRNMRQKRNRSLVGRFTFQFVANILLFTVLFAGVFFLIFISFWRSSFRTVQDSLRFYDSRISAELSSDINSVLETCMTNTDVAKLRVTRDRAEEVHCITRIKSLLTSHVSLNSVIKGLYVYYPEKDIFIPGYNSGYTNSNEGPVFPKFIGELLASHTADGKFDRELPKSWFFYRSGGRNYLLRVVFISKICAGAWIDLDELPGFSDFSGSDAIQLITDPDGQVLYASSSLNKEGFQRDAVSELALPVAESLTRPVSVRIPGVGSRIAVSEKQSFSDYCFTVLLPERQFVRTLSPLLWFGLFFLLWSIFFFFSVSRLTKRIFELPSESLSSVIERIHNGDFESRAAPPDEYEETARIVSAFNELIREIGDLRIHVYEEQLAAREFELRALRNQVAPHFLINCLNTIFMSAQDQSRLEMTNQIITTLSSHLRYTLSDRDRVPLSEELEYLENYILLTQSRFPETLSFEKEADPEILDAAVFPQILLTLTENSVKTGLIMGEPFLIRVRASAVTENGELFVRLVHTDSGTGLSEEKLDQYNHIFDHPEVTEKGTGIGLYNTAMRLRLLLGPEASIRFRNEEGMGLSVELSFKYRKYTGIDEEQKNEPSDHR